ncbi:hypothetical protein EDD29_6679 [Actinocorallia herbida]|uniref:Uncharacterized protein n=1 Tax=Actinocorallia herbida TaxID=58109 RepID=A0A3N1D625_9ACTN|nr:hypothetical protein [Actinocorallia herbida]ROO88992.1 hypothetical protein EDD29_6679 [Actinocorallia herbida]
MSEPEIPSEDAGRRARGRRYAALIIALSAVVIGLCTVVGEALIPRTLPPRDGLGWLAFLGAVSLFTAVFAATAAVTGSLGSISLILARRPLRERLSRLRGRLSRVGGAALFIAVVATVMWQLVDPVKLVKDTEVGGLDFGKYCKSYGYSANDDEFCSLGVPLAKACDWQYGSEGHTFVMTSGPYSGRCFDGKKKYVGGIKDMAGYCRERFAPSPEVGTALIDGTTWACRTNIDKDLACAWQYQQRDLAAREEGGLWLCYR